MKPKLIVAGVIEAEMKSVSDNLDAGQMDCFSMGAVRYILIRDKELFDSPNQALFWFNKNRPWVMKTFNELNKIYNLPIV
jgi:hypothetical protein